MHDPQTRTSVVMAMGWKLGGGTVEKTRGIYNSVNIIKKTKKQQQKTTNFIKLKYNVHQQMNE